MTIIDQSDLLDSSDPLSQREFDLYKVSKTPVSGGKPYIDAESSAYTWLDRDGRAYPLDDQNGGQGVAGRVGNIAGRVRIEELQAALDPASTEPWIKHALAITVPCAAGTAVYPATKGKLDPGPMPSNQAGLACTEMGLKSNDDAPPMGARLYLNLDIDQPRFAGIPPWKKVFLRTLVKYGAIVMDTGTDNYWDWQMESDLQYLVFMPANSEGPWFAWASSLINPANDMFPDQLYGPGARGMWDSNFDGIGDWDTEIWDKLEVLAECASDSKGCG